MKVRFKIPTDEAGRVSYELYSDKESWEWDEITDKYELCWELKGVGFVPIRLLEVTEHEKDIPYVDIQIAKNNNNERG